MDTEKGACADVVKVLHHLTTQGVVIPDFVLQKTAFDPFLPNLPELAWADPGSRRFPMHTKADTWVSNAMFRQLEPSLPLKKTAKAHIKEMLYKGADLWNISDEDLASMDKVLGPQLAKTAEDDGVDVSTPEAFDAFAAKIFSRLQTESFKTRCDTCRNVLKLAEDKEVRVSPQTLLRLEQSAGRGTCTVSGAEQFLLAMKYNLPKTAKDMHTVMDACMDALEDVKSFPDTDVLLKIATAADVVQRARPDRCRMADLPETHLFALPLSVQKFAADSVVHACDGGIISKDLIERNREGLGEDLSLMTGRLVKTGAEVTQALQNLSPVMRDRVLATVE